MHTLREKQLACELLGSLYLCKPNRQVLESWRHLLGEPAPAILDEIFTALRQLDPASEEAVDELAWEYTRLFIGPYKLPAPPWESVYTSAKRLMMQDAYDQVRECYREAGFQVDQAGLMADHIGLELTFLSMLYRQMLEAPGQRKRLSTLANGFVENHQINWVPRFAEDMELAAELPLYAALSRATREIVYLQS